MEIPNPNNRRVGLEIETVCNRNNYELLSNIVTNREPFCLSASRDVSIKPLGIELRTRPFSPSGLYLVSLKELLDDIKNTGGSVNHTCGLHIHVDFHRRFWLEVLGPYMFGLTVKNIWLKELATNYKDYVGFLPFDSRQSYANPTFTSLKGVRYSAVNYETRYDTLEIRMFNAHLSMRWICRAIRCALQITDLIDGVLKKLA